MFFINELKARNEALFYFGLACLIAAMLFLLLSRFSDIQVNNTNAWYKPFKFSVSIFLYSWTMAWICYYLPSFNLTMFNMAVILLLGFEILYIALQSGRGQMSHFNKSTPFYSLLFNLMAIAATLVVLYTAYIGWLFITNTYPSLPEYYVWSIRLGIIIFVIFSFEGFMMGSRLSHTVGGSDGSAGIPVLNWSKSYGDLRVAHFIGMHALQMLPLLSFYILKSTKATIIASLLYGLLAIYTMYVALQSKPIFSS